METEYEGIIISRNWDSIISFKSMCENAKFVFSHKSDGKERVKIVTKFSFDGLNCFEIGNDRYGIVENASTTFGNNWGGMIDDSSKEIIPFIKKYLTRIGASDLITNITTP